MITNEIEGEKKVSAAEGKKHFPESIVWLIIPLIRTSLDDQTSKLYLVSEIIGSRKIAISRIAVIALINITFALT